MHVIGGFSPVFDGGVLYALVGEVYVLEVMGLGLGFL